MKVAVVVVAVVWVGTTGRQVRISHWHAAISIAAIRVGCVEHVVSSIIGVLGVVGIELGGIVGWRSSIRDFVRPQRSSSLSESRRGIGVGAGH
jgi:hypothetical protein